MSLQRRMHGGNAVYKRRERNRMIDLHVHILPGLDDGAENREEALEMAELALEGGTEILVATPHSNQKGRFENYYSEKLKEAYRDFQEALKREHIPLKICMGMEIFAAEDMCERLEDGSLIGLNGTDVCLTEFPFDAEPYWIGERLEDMLEQKKRPLIAHPERYFCVQDYPGLLYEWLRMGCMTQMNKGSIFGRFGRRAGRAAETLLKYDLITCIASDAHSSYMRTTYMGDIWDYVEERFGEGAAYRLLQENPEKIIENREVPVHGRFPEKKRRFFW